MQQALLAVSFGTAVPKAMAEIEAVESQLRAQCPDRRFYRAFTSPRIRAILAKRGQKVLSLAEALAQMQCDGVKDAVVQPTHVIYGYEYDKIRQTVEENRSRFETLRLGAPLFSHASDLLEVAQILDSHYSPQPGKRFVFMGHGTDHFADFVYPALETALRRRGREDCFLATVEGWPDFKSVSEKLESGVAVLVPLMLVAGAHALEDMAGEDPQSLKSMLQASGCRVECVQQGLGSVPEIRKIYAHHLQAALAED